MPRLLKSASHSCQILYIKILEVSVSQVECSHQWLIVKSNIIMQYASKHAFLFTVHRDQYHCVSHAKFFLSSPICFLKACMSVIENKCKDVSRTSLRKFGFEDVLCQSSIRMCDISKTSSSSAAKDKTRHAKREVRRSRRATPSCSPDPHTRRLRSSAVIGLLLFAHTHARARATASRTRAFRARPST